jgi:hypothetical protein
MIRTWLPQFRAKNAAGTVLYTYAPPTGSQGVQPWVSVDIANGDDVRVDRELATFGRRPGFVGVFWKATVVFKGMFVEPPYAPGYTDLRTVLSNRFASVNPGGSLEAAFDYNGGTPVWKRVTVLGAGLAFSKVGGLWVGGQLELSVETADPQVMDYVPYSGAW